MTTREAMAEEVTRKKQARESFKAKVRDLWTVEGLTDEDIGTRLGCSGEAVRRARAELHLTKKDQAPRVTGVAW